MIELNGIWKMKRSDEERWQKAIVPGSVYTDLLNNGTMKDPFFGENEDEIKNLSAFDYEYKRNFTLTSGELAADRLVLVCEGLDTLAELYINDVEIGKAKNMHRLYRYDIKPYLKAGENTLEIVLYSPLQYIEKKNREKELWGVSSTVEGYQHLRKAHCMFGWDWGPKLPDLGIWRNIYIEEINSGRVKDFYVKQKHQKDSVQLNLTVENEFLHENTGFETEFIIKDPKGSLVYEGKLKSEALQTISYEITKPQFWWPNNYGEQPLYEITIRLLKQEQVISQKTKKIGLRTLTVRKDKDQWGESFGFEINGRVIFAMGANYIPEDNLLGRNNRQRTKKLLESCVRANFNCIRVWGGAYYQEDYFYDLCDEMGLVVWQDFMFACAVYDLNEEFESNIRQEFEDNIRRIRNHASLGMWCGNNEMEMAWNDWGLPQNEKLRQDYTTMFERILPEMVRKLDPETFYWPASPSSGGGFLQANSQDKGDAHYWDVWHGKKLFEDFEKYYFRFASEYGFQSMPSMKTIKTFALPEDYNMFSNVMEKHQKCVDNGNGNITLMTYLFNYYPYPKDFETTVYATQILQGDCLETAISHWRRNRGRCLGSTYWQLNDCNPVISWSTVDYYGRWKAAHYIVKRCYAPVFISAKEEKREIHFHVTNDSFDNVQGILKYDLIHQQKGLISSGQLEVNTSTLTAEDVGKISLADMEEFEKRECYLAYELWIEGKCMEKRTLLLVKPKQFHFLKPQLETKYTEEKDRIMLECRADVYARRVGIEFKNTDVILEDNYFDLLPGEWKTVTIRKEDIQGNVTMAELMQEMQIISNYDIGYRY